MITITTTTTITHTTALLELQPESLERVLGTPSQSVISSTRHPTSPSLPSFQIYWHSVLGASVMINNGLSPFSFVHLIALRVKSHTQTHSNP